jgi:hypothetical protein
MFTKPKLMLPFQIARIRMITSHLVIAAAVYRRRLLRSI